MQVKGEVKKMNYDVSKSNLAVRDLVFEGCKEVPVDMDFSLPDYCPDIQKILKCRVIPNISSKSISGDRLNIEGTAKIKTIYLDAESKRIRSCENSMPFSCSVDIKSSPENAVADVSIKVEYVNCRAVSPRKLDIHGSFSISAKVYAKKNVDISSNVSGKDIQQRISDMRVNNLAGIGQQQFSISEVIETDQNKPAPESIINSDVKVIVNDYKNMPNKTVVKGEIIVKILYIDDISSGHTDTLSYSIPMSQIIDVPSVSEDSRCVINASVLSHDEQINSENENAAFIACEIKLSVTVMAYQDKDISLVSDVYSTDYDVDISTDPVKIDRLVDNFKEEIEHKEVVKFSDVTLSEVVDAWVDACTVSCTCEDGKLEFKCKANVCVLAVDSEETPVYVERILEFTHSKAYESNLVCAECESSIVPAKISFNLSGQNGVEVNLTFELFGQVYSCRKCTMVKEVSADESKTVQKDGASLTVYYAEGGENIWDIAKKYYTCAQMIKDENDLSEDRVRNSGMLLIPMK